MGAYLIAMVVLFIIYLSSPETISPLIVLLPIAVPILIFTGLLMVGLAAKILEYICKHLK